jgi:RNA polymerase sigma-70 factor (ECF subfamily)
MGRPQQPAASTATDAAEPSAQIDEVFRALSRDLFHFASKLPPGRTGPHDLVQEAFIAAFRDWAHFCELSGSEQLRWLKTVVRRRSIDSYRRHRREGQLPEHRAERGPDDSEAVLRQLDEALLDQCWTMVERMPPIRRQVAHLSWWEKLPTGEVAGLLGIAESTVRGHVKLARDEIVSRLGGDVAIIDDTGDVDELRAYSGSAGTASHTSPLQRARIQMLRDVGADGRRTDGT